ncbi:hypothetical protein [Streptomyces sp. 303MFCol5.2]|uniref:hypothetical protein n=1 Tax=Streptomyces sp. 303MFCol5.2 TaxID=1172181 RepID=UPI0003770E44|nr:hypothetical protein [Streptomyces sp. 303MFCol5.2]
MRNRPTHDSTESVSQKTGVRRTNHALAFATATATAALPDAVFRDAVSPDTLSPAIP